MIPLHSRSLFVYLYPTDLEYIFVESAGLPRERFRSTYLQISSSRRISWRNVFPQITQQWRALYQPCSPGLVRYTYVAPIHGYKHNRCISSLKCRLPLSAVTCVVRLDSLCASPWWKRGLLLLFGWYEYLLIDGSFSVYSVVRWTDELKYSAGSTINM